MLAIELCLDPRQGLIHQFCVASDRSDDRHCLGRESTDRSFALELDKTIARVDDVEITVAQAEALEAELGVAYIAAAGMRFSDPSIQGAVVQLVERGAEAIVGICMSPQWSPTLMGGYARELSDAATHAGVPSVIAPAWFREPAYVAATAERLRDALRDAHANTAVILTAHSLPKRVFDAEPEYVAQLHETAELVAAEAGLRPVRGTGRIRARGTRRRSGSGPI